MKDISTDECDFLKTEHLLGAAMVIIHPGPQKPSYATASTGRYTLRTSSFQEVFYTVRLFLLYKYKRLK
jgi:hypothetical protein